MNNQSDKLLSKQSYEYLLELFKYEKKKMKREFFCILHRKPIECKFMKKERRKEDELSGMSGMSRKCKLK